MFEPIVDVEDFTHSGLRLIAEADRFMEQWGSGVDMDYARSLAQLAATNLISGYALGGDECPGDMPTN